MIDTAEIYSNGQSEIEMCALPSVLIRLLLTLRCSGRVIKELNLERTDLIITTKVYFGFKHGGSPNDQGLSRKQ